MKSPSAGSRLFLIGSDASHAMSASLWNPVLKELKSDWRYEGWDVPAGASMAAVRARLLDGDVVAANVTMPHKQWAAQAADTVSEPVRLSGAANLLTVADRDTRAAADLACLAAGLGMSAEARPWGEAQSQARDASLIVNATPIGKGVEDGPVWGDGALAQDAVVYDFVYAGHVTASIALAARQGLTCVEGWDHLEAQAAAMVPLLGLASEACRLLAQTLAQIRAGH